MTLPKTVTSNVDNDLKIRTTTSEDPLRYVTDSSGNTMVDQFGAPILGGSNIPGTGNIQLFTE